MFIHKVFHIFVRLNVLGHVDVSWTSKRTLTYIYISIDSWLRAPGVLGLRSLCTLSNTAVLQLLVTRNTSCCAGGVVANVTFIDDAIVHRLSVNP